MTRGTVFFAVSGASLLLAVASPLAAQDHSPASPTSAASTSTVSAVVPTTSAATSSPSSPAARPDTRTIRWAPSTGRDCHVFHGRRMCEGPRRVPLLDGDALRRAEALDLVGPRVARTATTSAPPTRWVEAAREAGATEATDLLWPVPEGRLWRGFGPRQGFRRTRRGLVRTRRRHMHQGVDIGAHQGSVIVAVADGLVAYSDNRMSGYGNAVLLVHADGAVSMYAHCVETYVTPGQFVRRGEVIAAVGQTGIAHGAHLHFEYRERGRTVDPYRRFTQIPELPPLSTTRRGPRAFETGATPGEPDDPSFAQAGEVGPEAAAMEPAPAASEAQQEPVPETVHDAEP